MSSLTDRFRAKYRRSPTNYALTAYDAVLVVADAAVRVIRSGKMLSRGSIRDALQATKMDSLQGPIEFDQNGDLLTPIVAIYQVVDGRFRYVGVAPLE
jgi:ABC-type branched-subunit amino acid transport system substrate-binding protein